MSRLVACAAVHSPPLMRLDFAVTGLAHRVRIPSGRLALPAAPTHRKRAVDALACVHPNAAGRDIGSEAIVVAVPLDRHPQPVRVFQTFTADLHALVAWLRACGIATVAMESTGVFWIPIYELLEQAGVTPYLVNARHVKTVPGRTTDWTDAQWLQKLHAFGLLQGSFRPAAEIRTLRTLARYRAALIERRAPQITHMIQARKPMHIQRNLVVTDRTGVSGLAMLRAISAKARDPQRLTVFRQPGWKHSEAALVKALPGTGDATPIFILTQAVDLVDSSTLKLIDCDRQLEPPYQARESRWEKAAALPDLPPAKRDSPSKNALTVNARAHIARRMGVDLVAVMGVRAITVQTIIREVGTAMARFATVKHFCAWRG
jgi:transposase